MKTSEIVKNDSEDEVVKNDGSIDIPGFEAMIFTAEEEKQQVNLSNPEQNNCYFVITIQLEDGTVLWKSDFIKPGYTVTSIKLRQTLASGTYSNSVIKYECFGLDDKNSQLNGAETLFTLFVK